MAMYRVVLGNGYVDVIADLVRVENSHYDKIEGQQQTVCFYKGANPTMDHVVAEFTYKNIAGYYKLEHGQLLRTEN